MDAVGFRGDVLQRLGDQAGVGVTVYTPPVEQPRKSDAFKPEEFVLDESRQILTCPAGQQTTTWSEPKHGRPFYFSVKPCRACPLMKPCLSDGVRKTRRKVFKSLYFCTFLE